MATGTYITVETIARSWRDERAAYRAMIRDQPYTYARETGVAFDVLMEFVADEVLGAEECRYAYRVFSRDRESVVVESRCMTHPDEPPQCRGMALAELWEVATPVEILGVVDNG